MESNLVSWFSLFIELSHTIVPNRIKEAPFRKVYLRSMIGESRQLVPDEPVEFEKQPVEVQDYRKNTGHFRGLHGIHPKSIKENRRT